MKNFFFPKKYPESPEWEMAYLLDIVPVSRTAPLPTSQAALALGNDVTFVSVSPPCWLSKGGNCSPVPGAHLHREDSPNAKMTPVSNLSPSCQFPVLHREISCTHTQFILLIEDLQSHVHSPLLATHVYLIYCAILVWHGSCLLIAPLLLYEWGTKLLRYWQTKSTSNSNKNRACYHGYRQ